MLFRSDYLDSFMVAFKLGWQDEFSKLFLHVMVCVEKSGNDWVHHGTVLDNVDGFTSDLKRK